MKKLLIIISLFLFAGCTKDLYTPIPETNKILFEKEGNTVTLMISGSCFFHYDKNIGYTYMQDYSDGMLKSMTLNCGWVSFVIENFYSGNIHYTEPRLIIKAEPNETDSERSLKIELEDRLNGNRSGRSSITVTQKED